MGEHYDHITEEERCEIGRLHAAGQSRSAIAAYIGRDKSTISRELRRNASASGHTGYNAITADRKAGIKAGAAIEPASIPLHAYQTACLFMTGRKRLTSAQHWGTGKATL